MSASPYEQLRQLARDLEPIALHANAIQTYDYHDDEQPGAAQQEEISDQTADIAARLCAYSSIPDEPVIARVICNPYGTMCLEWCAEDEVDLNFTHLVHEIITATDPAQLDSLSLSVDDILCNAAIDRLFTMYSMWRPKQLRVLASLHNVPVSDRDNRETLVRTLLVHSCDIHCPPNVVCFTSLSKPRPEEQVAKSLIGPCHASTDSEAQDSYLREANESLKHAIIREWQATLSTANLELAVCAPCARRVTKKELVSIHPNDFDLKLLRNDALHPRTWPKSYAFDLYQRALLDPRGMSDRWNIAAVSMCVECRRELVEKTRMPRLSLANWLYYAHDTLPPAVCAAFARSSQFDRLLVARARASRISFRFTELHANDTSNLEPVDAHESRVYDQRFVRGNVLVMPQNSTHLNAVLPPPPSVIHDTVCAVFVGREQPTMETIGGLSPVLVRKSTVETIIRFLVTDNPYYVPDGETFFGFSATNLQSLFSPEESRADLGVPCAMDIGFIPDSEGMRGTTADYTGRNQLSEVPGPDEPLLMENVGYTCGDKSPVSYRDMKLRALSHCLNGGKFVRSQAGDTFVPDFRNPALLTWLFPHLDPWGIGGFHHPDRSVPISMEEQLTYLLQVADGPFQRDPDFAFVYFNILQKKAVCDSVHFRVKESEQRRIVDKLLAVDRAVLERLIAKFDADKHYVPDTAEEAGLLALVNNVGAVLRDIPGTSGYKLNMRNEIRSLVNFYGTPAFFITLNPSDVNHPLVRLYAGQQVNLEDASVGEELTEWRRKLLVARNPGVCAMFFHTMISNFVSIILRHGRDEPGLFGTCTAYYGTVEAQARGTLHCHLLIWVKDHPSPQKMRDMMISDAEYQERMFAWLESLIKCEPLGTSSIVQVPSGLQGRRPRHSERSGCVHPGARRLPQINVMPPADFRDQYHLLVNQLVEQFNWHEHTETCWKYLRRRDPRSDANCRMRMDGSTRMTTQLDPDSQSILLRRLHPWISSYNDLVIFLMQANMDIKHIGSGEGAKALIFYITDYITKASLPAHLGLAALLYAVDRTNVKYGGLQRWTPRENSGALTILVNSMLSRQEISHQQVMSYLVGGGDHYTSHRYRLLHFRVFERLIIQYWEPPPQMPVVVSLTDSPSTLTPTIDPSPATDTVHDGHLSPASHEPTQIQIEEEDSVTLTLSPGSISAINQQQDYLLRPATEPFASMPLYQYTGMTEKLTCTAESRRLSRRSQDSGTNGRQRGRPQEERGTFHPTHPQHTTHLVRKRVTWVIPVVLNSRLPRHDGSYDQREVRCRTILALFVPWRSPADLKHPHETWTEAYERRALEISPHHQTIIHNMNVLTECKDARDKAVAARRRGHASSLPAVTIAPFSEDRERAGAYPQTPFAPTLTQFPAGIELDVPTQPATRPTTVATIDDLISAPARVALDRCFHNDPNVGDGAAFGAASQVVDEDEAGLATQQAAMRKLKRKRRPSPSPPPPPPRYNPYASTLARPAVVDVGQLNQTMTPSASSQMPTLNTYVPQIHLDPSGFIRQVAVEFQLDRNPEQLRAFEIVARHVCFGGPQLLMYIAGVGGTGKSYVVTAILRLFDLLGRRRQIFVSAPTGAAALLIGGFTVHALLMLPHKEGIDLQPLVPLWACVLYLIVDEISMISATLLAQISMRLQHAKGNSDIAEDIPFGGVNVIFLGDFGQLRPVGGPPLYSHELIKSPDLKNMQSVQGISALKGVYLWRLVRTVVILRRNQRQSGDLAYSELLARIREGNSGNARRANNADDYSTLQTRLIQNFDAETARRFRDAPVIVGIKAVRDPLNERILTHHARRICADVHLYHSQDRVPYARLDRNDRELLWNLPSSISKDSLGKLPLFPGMKVMVQENIAFACKVVNGAIGTVRDIKYTEEDDIRYVTAVYVEIPGAGKYFGPDHDDIIPIFPVTTTFTWTITRKTDTSPAQTISITRLQVPLLPAYAFTDYKSQGRSLDQAIVDPDSAMSIQGVYVMLSRVRTLDGLAILHPFRRKKTEDRISQALREEFARLEKLDRYTTRAHHSDPRQHL